MPVRDRSVDTAQVVRGLGALVFVVGSAMAYIVFQLFPAFALLAVGVSLGGLLYALFGGRDVPSFEWQEPLPKSGPYLPGVLTVVFFLASAASVLVLSTAYYTKPLAYYVFVAVAVGAVGLRVVFTNAHRTNVWLAVLLGLNTYVSNQLAFPLGLNGPDFGAHAGWTRTILETGHIAENTLYTGFPGQHVLAATAVLFTGGELGLTYRAFGIAGMSLGLPIAYLLTKRFVARRYAAFGVLVYASMDYVIYRAGHPSKLAYALPLFLLVFTLIVYLAERRTPGRYVLFALFALALIFTHHHMAFVGAIMVVTSAGGLRIASEARERGLVAGSSTTSYGRGDDEGIGGRSHVLAILFLVAFLTQFVYWSGIAETFVRVSQQYFDVLFKTGGEDTTKETIRFAVIPLEQLLINTVGSGLLFVFVVVGGLSLFREDTRWATMVLAWLSAAGVAMVGGVIFDTPFALPQRIFVMAQLTGLGLLAVVGLVYLFKLAEGRETVVSRSSVAAVVIMLLVGFSFFSAASTVAGIETSPFNEDVAHRTWYELEEDRAVEEFLVTADVNRSSFQWARGLPVSESREMDYSALNRTAVYGTNRHKISKGVTVSGGKGRIGTGQYVFPELETREEDTRAYNNGVIDIYVKSGGST